MRCRFPNPFPYFDGGVHLVTLDSICDAFRMIFRIFTLDVIWDGTSGAFQIFELKTKKKIKAGSMEDPQFTF